jgi:hypothetical protein
MDDSKYELPKANYKCPLINVQPVILASYTALEVQKKEVERTFIV